MQIKEREKNMAFNSLADFDSPELEEKEVVKLPVSKIEIWQQQPRNYIDPEELVELSRSIEKFEQLAPIVVRPHPERADKYLIVVGEKRFRAMELAGKTEIEAKIRELDEIEAYEIALVENRRRSGLNPIDDTLGTLTLIEKKTGIDRDTIVNYLHRLGNKKEQQVPFEFLAVVNEVFERTSDISLNTFIKKRLRLLKLPSFIFLAIQEGRISYSNGVMFVKVAQKNEKVAAKLLEDAIVQKWSRDLIREKINQSIATEKEEEPKKSDLITENLRKAYRKLSRSPKILNDPKKQKQLQRLVSAMEKLLDVG